MIRSGSGSLFTDRIHTRNVLRIFLSFIFHELYVNVNYTVHFLQLFSVCIFFKLTILYNGFYRICLWGVAALVRIGFELHYVFFKFRLKFDCFSLDHINFINIKYYTHCIFVYPIVAIGNNIIYHITTPRI